MDGELLKVRSTVDESYVLDWEKDLHLGDLDPNGHQLRPHIVWFGEMVPLLEQAISITQTADILIIIGTSMQVYPAASLANYAPAGIPMYFIDPKPSVDAHAFDQLRVIAEPATKGVPDLVTRLCHNAP